MNQKETKLITITRSDITPGYQLVQSNHSIADFAYEHPLEFKKWKEESNSIVSLSIGDQDKLIDLYDKLSKLTACTIFYEPDISSYTSICLYGTPEIRKKLSKLPLALKDKKEVYDVV